MEDFKLDLLLKRLQRYLEEAGKTAKPVKDDIFKLIGGITKGTFSQLGASKEFYSGDKEEFSKKQQKSDEELRQLLFPKGNKSKIK